MRSQKGPAGIGSLIDRCLDRVAGQEGAAAIWRVWEDAVGAQIARRAQPLRLRGRTLLVAVSSAPWMQELVLLKPTIRAELNARLSTPLVADLFFVASESADPPPPRSVRPLEPPRRCVEAPAAVDLTDLPLPVRESFSGLFAAWQRRARRGGAA